MVKGSMAAPKLTTCIGLFLTISTITADSIIGNVYSKGKESAAKQDWMDCREKLASAVMFMETYYKVASSCANKCYKRDNLFGGIEEILRGLDSGLSVDVCMKSCYSESSVTDFPSTELVTNFNNRLLYRELCDCAFKDDEMELATRAAFTYYAADPANADAEESISFYKRLARIQQHWQISNLQQPHENYFLLGVTAYEREDWSSVREHMERAVEAYQRALEQVLGWCLASATPNTAVHGYSDVLTNLRVSTVSCMFREINRLDFISDRTVDNVYPLMFHYLQFVYGKLGRQVETAVSVANYLKFQPGDAVMLRNKKYYLSSYEQLTDRDFTPDSQFVVPFADLLFSLKEFLNRYNSMLNSERQAQSLQQSPDRAYGPPLSVILSREELEESVNTEAVEYLESQGIHVSMTEVDLEAPQRVVIDNIISSEECRQLTKLANAGAVVGDGYMGQSGRTSPHTDRETFAGLTVDKAALGAVNGEYDVEAAKLYLTASEKARDVVARYFGLQTPLYFDYTHLVCRTALEDRQKERVDLSHPIHSDNCVIQNDFSCKRSRDEAYIQRDFSALLYLGGSFEGGQFIFAHRNLTDHKLVDSHACGRMAAFNASVYHGVKAVTKGQRCALAMWFTLDPDYDERSHQTARYILREGGYSIPDQDYWAHLTDRGPPKQQRIRPQPDEL